jgi:hypothetical protein
MTPPGPHDGLVPTVEGPTTRPMVPSLEAETLHRHLRHRVAIAHEQLRALEDRTQAPDALVARFGATVAETQRSLLEERTQAERRVAALRSSARQRAEQLVAEAEAEARVLRAVATWLGRVPVGGEDRSRRDTASRPTPVLAAVQARAS